MYILITGANGFIGRNLTEYLKKSSFKELTILPFTRANSLTDLKKFIVQADFIFHLAGENRPEEESTYIATNLGLTQIICDLCTKYHPIPILLASSSQAVKDNPYGQSKLAAEAVLKRYAEFNNVACYITRLPGVFGKWCKPNYNSVVATWCYNITRSLPITITDPDTLLPLVYIDDVVESFLQICRLNTEQISSELKYIDIQPLYEETLGNIYNLLNKFLISRKNLMMPNVGHGFTHALYSTYLSYLPEDKFSYPLEKYLDDRGAFFEILKSHDFGQISVFTGKPGFIRGNHFHHTKVEKFILLHGSVKIHFRRVYDDKIVMYEVNAAEKKVIDIPPGYVHNVENIGDCDFIMLVWANEVFNRNNPDTYHEEVYK